VKLLAWDHNYGQTGSNNTWVPATFPQSAMQCSNGTSDSKLDVVGYHNYDGTDHIEDVQNKFRADCGDKGIYVTEMTGTAGNPVKAEDYRSNMWWRLHHQLFRPLRSWAKGSLYWNIALDANYGPRPAWVCPSNCQSMVTVKSDGTYTKNEEYYYYAQFSKFIQPGATRIASDEPKLPVPNKTAYPVETVAFKNLDGSIVVIAMCQNYA
jgi:glucosylceramidase